MYIKTEDLLAVLKDDDLKYGDARAKILGMLAPFDQYTQEQVNQEQAAETECANEEPALQKIEFSYDGDMALKMAIDGEYCINNIVDDFLDGFKKQFSGMPSDYMLAKVAYLAERVFNNENKDHMVSPDREVNIKCTFHLPPRIGICGCPTCKITPLN